MARFTVTRTFAAADTAKGVFVAPVTCKVISAIEAHGTVAGQAGVLNIEKCNTGEAPAAGDLVFPTGWNLESTANTPVSLTAVVDGKQILAVGDELRFILTSGASTSLADATITLLMEWIP